jgi:uncharacterized membrane protein (UPF0127 family)
MKKKLYKHNPTYYIWAGIILLCVAIYFAMPLFQVEVNKNVAKNMQSLRDDIKLTLPQGEIYAQIASTLNARELGLSFRDGIGDDEGLLFIFEKPDVYTFWMKDMKFSIDIIWLSEDGQVVHIEENVSPDTYPKKLFSNKPLALYVLELNAGQARKYGIYLGTRVGFPKPE